MAEVDGDKIVHLCGFGKVRPACDTPSGRTPFFLVSVTKSFTALAAWPSGLRVERHVVAGRDRLATTSTDNSAKVWKSGSGLELMLTLRGHQDKVYSIAWSLDVEAPSLHKRRMIFAGFCRGCAAAEAGVTLGQLLLIAIGGRSLLFGRA